MGLPFAVETRAASYVDSENRVTLTVTPTPSTASGHLAWQFEVSPMDAATEISSIDASTAGYGFAGEYLRHVSPNGLSTVFADFNGLFPAGEDGSTDTQFTFSRSGLIVAPGSDTEDAASLAASFTGFEPIRADSTEHRFAQIVMPLDGSATFFGAFAVRSIDGGPAQLAEIGPIEFSARPGDFDFDGDIDGNDFLVWQRSPLFADLADWQANYGSDLSVSTFLVPEPRAVTLFFTGILLGSGLRLTYISDR